MDEGVLGEAIINVDHPKAEEKFNAFIKEVRAAQVKQGVAELVCLQREIQEKPRKIEIIFIAVSMVKGKIDALKNQGFSVSNPVSEVSISGFKSFSFEKEVSFGDMMAAKKKSNDAANIPRLKGDT